MTGRERHRIVISGYYGFGNAGDEAILAAMLQALSQHIPDAEFCVLSDNPSQTLSQFGVRAVGRKNPLAIAREMMGARLLISGGGGLLQDTTGLNTIRYYLGVVKLALWLRVPVMFYAQGIGPIHSDQGKNLIRHAASRVKLITVRDDRSKDLLTELGVTGPPVVVTADPVLALRPATREQVDEICKQEQFSRDRPWVGLSLRPWANSQHVAEAFVGLGKHLIGHCGMQVVVLPFQESQDRSLCERIAVSIGEHCQVLRQTYPPEEFAGLLGRMHSVIAMRLHALIFAAQSGVPLAGIAYDPKVSSFVKQVGGLLTEVADASAQRLIEMATELQTQHETYRQRLLKAVAGLADLALENARMAADLVYGREPGIRCVVGCGESSAYVS